MTTDTNLDEQAARIMGYNTKIWRYPCPTCGEENGAWDGKSKFPPGNLICPNKHYWPVPDSWREHHKNRPPNNWSPSTRWDHCGILIEWAGNHSRGKYWRYLEDLWLLTPQVITEAFVLAFGDNEDE